MNVGGKDRRLAFLRTRVLPFMKTGQQTQPVQLETVNWKSCAEFWKLNIWYYVRLKHKMSWIKKLIVLLLQANRDSSLNRRVSFAVHCRFEISECSPYLSVSCLLYSRFELNIPLLATAFVKLVTFLWETAALHRYFSLTWHFGDLMVRRIVNPTLFCEATLVEFNVIWIFVMFMLLNTKSLLIVTKILLHLFVP